MSGVHCSVFSVPGLTVANLHLSGIGQNIKTLWERMSVLDSPGSGARKERKGRTVQTSQEFASGSQGMVSLKGQKKSGRW